MTLIKKRKNIINIKQVVRYLFNSFIENAQSWPSHCYYKVCL